MKLTPTTGAVSTRRFDNSGWPVSWHLLGPDGTTVIENNFKQVAGYTLAGVLAVPDQRGCRPCWKAPVAIGNPGGTTSIAASSQQVSSGAAARLVVHHQRNQPASAFISNRDGDKILAIEHITGSVFGGGPTSGPPPGPAPPSHHQHADAQRQRSRFRSVPHRSDRHRTVQPVLVAAVPRPYSY